MGSSWEELTKSIEEIFKWLKGPYFKVSSWFEFWRLSAYLYWLVWFELSWVESSRVANSSCSNPRASQVWTINLHKNFTTFSLSLIFLPDQNYFDTCLTNLNVLSSIVWYRMGLIGILCTHLYDNMNEQYIFAGHLCLPILFILAEYQKDRSIVWELRE